MRNRRESRVLGNARVFRQPPDEEGGAIEFFATPSAEVEIRDAPSLVSQSTTPSSLGLSPHTSKELGYALASRLSRFTFAEAARG
jgi:hypothetical protein